MATIASHQIFAERLHLRLGEIQRLLGTDWPTLRDPILVLLEQLRSTDDARIAQSIVDRIVDLGAATAAADIFLETLDESRAARLQEDRLERSVRLPRRTRGAGRDRRGQAGAVDGSGPDLDAGSASGGVPGADDALSEHEGPRVFGHAAGEVEPPPTAAPERRWVNVEVQDHPKDTPLELSRRYMLVFDVDTTVREQSVVSDAGFSYAQRDDEDSVDILVELIGDDFNILTGAQMLTVPRAGPSLNSARFEIEPLREGKRQLTALLRKGNHTFQWIKIELQVGGPAQVVAVAATSMGRSLAGAHHLGRRDVDINILQDGGEFKLLWSSGQAKVATLAITPQQLEGIIDQARAALLEVVNLWPLGYDGPVFQSMLDIPADIQVSALKIFAQAGYDLYSRIFYDGAGLDLQQIGDRLRQLARREQLNITITSDKFLLPWGLLYVAERWDPDHIDPDLFLGMRHIIEHIPFQPDLRDISLRIDTGSGLHVSLNVNRGIDTPAHPLIEGQIRYWNEQMALRHGSIVVRDSEADVLHALADTGTPDQILYFNCHAASMPLSAGGPDQSFLGLTRADTGLTLGELRRSASIRYPLAGAPLVFINACQSAKLSPLFYDGFVPYFVQKGARGVIGTECDTPALFAAEWARRFFDRFLAGMPLGEVFLGLRQEFFREHNNLLGLLYALYCDADTHVGPLASTT